MDGCHRAGKEEEGSGRKLLPATYRTRLTVHVTGKAAPVKRSGLFVWLVSLGLPALPLLPALSPVGVFEHVEAGVCDYTVDVVGRLRPYEILV